MDTQVWKNCSSCKKSIGFNQKYFLCSVSTCQGDRTGYQFCSVHCWERHLPGARHRDAGAVEKTSPSSVTAAGGIPPSGGVRRIVGSAPASSPSTSSSGASVGWVSGNKTSMDAEVLVVVSKMKTYIKEKADMNTSGDVADLLSDKIRRLCDQAIEAARNDGRKTVMAKDF